MIPSKTDLYDHHNGKVVVNTENGRKLALSPEHYRELILDRIDQKNADTELLLASGVSEKILQIQEEMVEYIKSHLTKVDQFIAQQKFISENLP